MPPHTTQLALLDVWLRDLLTRWPAEDVQRVLAERVPGFVERTLRDLDARRANREQLAQLVATLCDDHCIDRFLHNPDTGAFYQVQANGQLQRQPSDFLLMQLVPHIPAPFYAHRYQILRAVKSKLTGYRVLDWTPSSVCVHRVLAEVQHNFGSLHEARYFMTVVGGVVTRQEDALLADDRIHLWHGPRVQEVLECVQQQLYRVHRLYSSFWNKVKRRVHHAYALANVWSLHFPAATSTTPLRSVRQSPELFFAVAAYCFRTFPMATCWATHPTLRPPHVRGQAADVVAAYLQTNVTVYAASEGATSADATPPAPNYLLLRELAADYREWLAAHRPVLPADLLSKQDFVSCIEAAVPQEATRGSKTLYRGSLQVGAAPTVHDLFRQFCQDTLRSWPAGGGGSGGGAESSTGVVVDGPKSAAAATADDTATDDASASSAATTTIAAPTAPPPTTPPARQRRSTRQLHNNYIVWCRHYAATLAAEEGPAPTGAPLLTDTHAKPWYCSYKLFEAFVERAYTEAGAAAAIKRVPTTPRWAVQVVPHKDTWKYYLHQFEQCGAAAAEDDAAHPDLGKWVEAEYGIRISDVTGDAAAGASLTSSPSFGPADASALDAEDIGSILLELNSFQG